MRWGIVVAGIAGLVIAVSVFSNVRAAEVTPTGQGGEWSVDDLDATPNKWHTYKGVLEPKYSPSSRSQGLSVESLQTVTHERPYFIDKTKPTITRIAPPPSDSNLDPNNLRIIYEITDNSGGSGLSLFEQGGTNASISTTVVSPARYVESTALKFEGEKKTLVYDIASSSLTKDEKIVVTIKAKDLAGNEATLTEEFGYKPNEEIGELLTGAPCEYLAGTKIAWVVTDPDNKIFTKGKDRKAVYDFYGGSREVMDEIKLEVQGPASVDEKSVEFVSGTIAVIGRRNLYKKSFEITETNSAKNGDKITVKYEYPETISVFLNKVTDEFGGLYCHDNYYKGPPERCGSAALCQTENSFGAGPNIPPVISDSRIKGKSDYYVEEYIPLPTGEIKFDKQSEVLTFEIENTSDVDFNANQSFSTLYSNTGRTETVNFNEIKPYNFKFKNVKEGRYRLIAGILANAIFKGKNSSFHEIDKSYTAKNQPPQIINFNYDYQAEELTLQVTDRGTELHELRTALSVGGKPYPVNLDENGSMIITLPQGLKSIDVFFSVADLAGQTAEQGVTILGKEIYDFQGGITQNQTEEESGTTNSSVASQTASSQRQGYQPIGHLVNGKQQFIRCYKNYRYKYPTDGRQTICDDPSSYNRACISRDTRPDGRGGPKPIWTELKRVTYTQCDPPRWLDNFSPVISNFIVNADAANFTANISDSGGPLDSIRVNYTVREDANNNLIANVHNAAANGSYDGRGNVAANYDVDAEREIVKIVLSARDSSGNSATATKKVISPKSPPNIVFSHIAINDAIGSTLLFAEFQDRSGIDIPLTELSIDGAPCVSQLLSAGQGNSASYRDALKWVCRAQLNEGQHVFTAKGADGVGLVAQAQYPFDINYKPTITSLVLNDVNPEEAGVNVFSAQIIDLGKNVDVSGIELSIDGQLVPSTQYLFDPVSGQFNALGPIAISEGLHTAQLRVTDASGNSDTRSLPFGRINNLVVNDPGTGDLQLDRVSVWELQNANGDGLINPGELVRLFPSFINTGALPLTNLTITTNINVLGVNIESPAGSIASINTGQTVSLLDGFDLRIDADFLRREGLQEKIVPIEFLVRDESGRSWQFTSDILVREPRESYQVITQSTIEAGSTAVLSAANILPSVQINSPPAITPVVFDGPGRDVAYTGTLTPADSPIQSVTYSLDGGAAIEIFDVDAGGGVVGIPGRLGGVRGVGGGFGFGGGSVTGNTFSINLPNTSFGVHVLVVTLRTADGDIAIDTDTFTVGG